jgi:spermidine/putrescine transport system substrate-binding protein
MDKKEADSLFQGFLAGAVDRRSFIVKLLAAGASAGTVVTLLDACGGGTAPADKGHAEGGEHDGKAKGKGKGKADGEGEDDESELGDETKELHIYNWSDYIAEDVVPAFEKETGIKTTYDTYESNEEMVAKVQIGASGYDLVCPTGYMVTVLSAQNLLHPLRKKSLKNWDNVHPMFVNPTFDTNNQYSVPWLWGTTGIAYRADKVNPAPDSWAVFHDPKYKNKMTQMDDLRDVLGSWLKYRGHSLNSTVDAELKEAKADAMKSKELLKAYISAPVKGQLVAGDVWIAQLWNGDTMQAAVENDQIKYALPKEGAGIWTDSLVIPAASKNKRAAHRFLNYILRPEVATKIADFTGYGTPNAKATPEKPVAYPSDEELKRLEYQKDLGAAIAVWDQLWTEIKSG